MPECPFCGTKEDKQYPLCQVCGALRYPIEKNSRETNISRHQRLKLSASIAAAIVTPGAFVVLAALGVNHISKKIKNRKM